MLKNNPNLLNRFYCGRRIHCLVDEATSKFMLTEAQKKYLETIPEDKAARVKAWDPKTKAVAEKIMERIRAADPNVRIYYTGASALKLPGENDLDFSILCPRADFAETLPKLETVLGKPQKIGKENIRWEDIKVEGYPVDVHLSDINSGIFFKEHLPVFELLKRDRKLWEEYKTLKEQADGLPYREYQRRKYEFYNKI